MAKITIKEIARLAGTSVSTVSRVLNDSPSVSPIKREKIKSVIAETHFQPSMLARGMVSSKTKTLAVLISDINNPYFTDMLSQIGELARKSDYTLLLINTMTAGQKENNSSVKTEIKAFQNIEERKVDGVLILGGEIDRENVNSEYLNSLNLFNERIPVVVIGQKISGCDALFIERDQPRSVEIITQHLLALGNRRIGFIGGQEGIRITTQRVEAFRKIMKVYSEIDEQLIILNDYYPQSGYDAAQQLINSKENLPDALVAINDRVALGAIRCFADNDIKVPNQIAIGSCDQFPFGDFVVPRVTSVDQHNEKLGKMALESLFKLIDKKPVEDIELINIPELVIRESCGAKLKREVN